MSLAVGRAPYRKGLGSNSSSPPRRAMGPHPAAARRTSHFPDAKAPGVRNPSHPGSVISIFGAAPRGSRSVLQKVVADLPYFDSRTRIFKLFLDFCRLLLVDAFLDRLRRRLDKVLGFLEAELRQSPHFLDHIDLLLADRGQDDIELGLFGDRLGGRRR